MQKIRIIVGDVTATATLNDSRTAKAIWDALPLEAQANRWGDEIYFATSVSLSQEDAREVVDAGDLAYWPPGRAFCIFWGPTPASRGAEIRPASPVNVFGRLDGDPKVFDGVRDGERIVVEKAADEKAG